MTYKGIGIHIKTADFAASKKFYDALGFPQVFAYGPEEAVKEAYRGATYDTGAGKLEIADGHRAVKPGVFKERIGSSKMSLMIPIDDVEAFLARLKKADIVPAVLPRHYYWGTIEVVVKDPDGVVLVFIAPYDASVARQIGADETYGSAESLPGTVN